MDKKKGLTRREFIETSTIAGASLMLGATPNASAAETPANQNIPSRGYAATDESGILTPWEFERRPVGDNDVLIDIKFASICHSDIHQMKGHWGPQQYPQVPGHEIVGVVAAVGKNVTKFKVGDRAGVGCMVDTCLECEDCKGQGEQYCPETTFTYGYPEKSSPTGISQGGYSNNIVVRDYFAVHIPESISFQEAAPLLCAGVTTYSPIMKAEFKKGDKVGVAGIGGLGHMAIKLAVSKGAEVYAFTTTPDKAKDILAFGAKEAIVVDDLQKLAPYKGMLDYMITTIPVQYDVAAYASVVKPNGFYTQVGMPEGFALTLSAIGMSINRVNFNASLIGDMKETQDVVNYCADHKIYPQIEVINAEQVNEAWKNVVDKKARYRYVIDAATI
ncbi:Zn-dependent alcohol dehydrogenase [Thiomicrospira sp. S5]|nr:Zn-dependent alcohol dehydrogenase [Thiomicrospira sp. S5]